MSGFTITMQLNDTLRNDRLNVNIACRDFLEEMYSKIDEDAKKIAIVINKNSAPIHMLDFFTLNECVKNSLDSNSTELTISIRAYCEDGVEMVNITLTDNGDGIKTPVQKYDHEQAFLKISEKNTLKKQNSDSDSIQSPILGGAGKGLAMSGQFISLFGEGSLLSGKAEKGGFEVSITAPNKPATVDWNSYISEFNRSFVSKIKHLKERTHPFSSSDEDLSASPIDFVRSTQNDFKKGLLQPNQYQFFVTPEASASPTKRGAPPLLFIPRDPDDENNSGDFVIRY